MEKVKISSLSMDDVVSIEGYTEVVTVAEILSDLEYYKEKEMYTTIPHYAAFNAEEIIDIAIEEVYCSGMYEDWDERINDDISKEDIEDMQKIFDRILARNPSQNIAYQSDKLIEIDV